jgi:hypothetical protein
MARLQYFMCSRRPGLGLTGLSPSLAGFFRNASMTPDKEIVGACAPLPFDVKLRAADSLSRAKLVNL